MSIFDDPIEPLPPGLEVDPIRSGDVEDYRRLAMGIALPLCLLCMAGIARLHFDVQTDDRRSATPVHSVPIALDVFERVPIEQSLTLRDDIDAPGFGEGHVAGNDAVDPALPKPPEPLGEGINVLPILQTPEIPPDHLPDAPQQGSYRTDLPKIPGGNGAASGTGRDASRGGERQSPLSDIQGAARPDFIYPVYRVKPVYVTEQVERTPAGVLVKLLLSKEGRVISAEAQNGPERYHQVCVNAAKQWLFHIPRASQTEAPIVYFIHFDLKTGG